MAKLFERDKAMGITRLFHYDDATEQFGIETLQDVTGIAEANKGVMATMDERSPWKGEMERVASIPMNIYSELVRKGIADDEKALRKWLDDPDNRVFRTRPGSLSR